MLSLISTRPFSFTANIYFLAKKMSSLMYEVFNENRFINKYLSLLVVFNAVKTISLCKQLLRLFRNRNVSICVLTFIFHHCIIICFFVFLFFVNITNDMYKHNIVNLLCLVPLVVYIFQKNCQTYIMAICHFIVSTNTFLFS